MTPPRHVKPAMQLAHAHRRAGRMAEAEAVCLQALHEKPNDAEMIALLGMLAHQGGRHDEAVERLRRSVELQPGRGEFHANLGAVLARRGRLEDALPYLQQAVQLRRNIWIAGSILRRRWTNWAGISRPPSSIRKTCGCLAAWPDHTWAWRNLKCGTGGLTRHLPRLKQRRALIRRRSRHGKDWPIAR